jgi:hypothetical protein
MTVEMWIVVFCFVALCSLVIAGGYQCFGSTYHLHFRREKISSSKMLVTTNKTTQCHNQEDYSPQYKKHLNMKQMGQQPNCRGNC